MDQQNQHKNECSPPLTLAQKVVPLVVASAIFGFFGTILALLFGEYRLAFELVAICGGVFGTSILCLRLADEREENVELEAAIAKLQDEHEATWMFEKLFLPNSRWGEGRPGQVHHVLRQLARETRELMSIEDVRQAAAKRGEPGARDALTIVRRERIALERQFDFLVAKAELLGIEGHTINHYVEEES